MQPADKCLCPGRGGPLAKGWIFSGISRTLVVPGPFPRWNRRGLVPGSGSKLGSTVPSPETSRRTPRTHATN